jgi:hypothetical protein
MLLALPTLLLLLLLPFSAPWPTAFDHVCVDAWSAGRFLGQHVGVEVAMGYKHTRR